MNTDKPNGFIAAALMSVSLGGCSEDPGQAIYGKWSIDWSQLPEKERTVESLNLVKEFYMEFRQDRLIVREPGHRQQGVNVTEGVVHEYRRQGDDIVVVTENLENGKMTETLIRLKGNDRLVMVESAADPSEEPIVLHRVDMNSVTGSYVCAGLGALTAVELTPEGKLYSTAKMINQLQEKAGTYEIDGNRLVATVDGETTVLTIDGRTLTSGDGLCVK